jgi:LmbE family N-acetylglucosaminyl deacetylase
VVLSTHLDDAVLSVGAWIHAQVRAGHRVEVLTVLGDDPDSTEPSSPWDRRVGFRTQGEAARVRRDEDHMACELLGAMPTVFPWGDENYDRGIDDDSAWERISERLEGADTVLVPGAPLLHPDHLWLATLVTSRNPRRGMGLYLEQPYAVLRGLKVWRWRWRPQVHEKLRDVLGSDPTWTVVRTGRLERRAKQRACRAYRSQIPLLGKYPPVLWRASLYETVRRGESIAWLS